MEIWIVTILLITTLYLLVRETITIDLTAIGIMVVLMLSGILTPREAVAGFANPAVITVGAMFLLSRAIIRSGAVGIISEMVSGWSRGNAGLAMLLVLLIVGLASAFINNTPVVVLFIPVIMSMGCRLGVSPSKYLIPLSYVSILAGTCTLIGTSTNIIVSDLAVHYGFAPIGMFELSIVGLPIFAIGLAIILLLAPRLMPELLNPTCELSNSRQRRYLAEMVIPRQSRLVGVNPCTGLGASYPDVQVLQVIRYSHIYHPCRDTVEIAPDDLLLVKGSPNALMKLLNDKVADPPPMESASALNGPQEAGGDGIDHLPAVAAGWPAVT